MERAKLYCEPIPYGRNRVIVQDIQGRQITGFLPYEQKFADVSKMKDHGDKVLVLLPRGFDKETAWINSSLLN